jgi:hypothetical protein
LQEDGKSSLSSCSDSVSGNGTETPAIKPPPALPSPSEVDALVDRAGKIPTMEGISYARVSASVKEHGFPAVDRALAEAELRVGTSNPVLSWGWINGFIPQWIADGRPPLRSPPARKPPPIPLNMRPLPRAVPEEEQRANPEDIAAIREALHELLATCR